LEEAAFCSPLMTAERGERSGAEVIAAFDESLSMLMRIYPLLVSI
jgi:hypothetical protein